MARQRHRGGQCCFSSSRTQRRRGRTANCTRCVLESSATCERSAGRGKEARRCSAVPRFAHRSQQASRTASRSFCSAVASSGWSFKYMRRWRQAEQPSPSSSDAVPCQRRSGTRTVRRAAPRHRRHGNAPGAGGSSRAPGSTRCRPRRPRSAAASARRSRRGTPAHGVTSRQPRARGCASQPARPLPGARADVQGHARLQRHVQLQARRAPVAVQPRVRAVDRQRLRVAVERLLKAPGLRARDASACAARVRAREAACAAARERLGRTPSAVAP